MGETPAPLSPLSPTKNTLFSQQLWRSYADRFLMKTSAYARKYPPAHLLSLIAPPPPRLSSQDKHRQRRETNPHSTSPRVSSSIAKSFGVEGTLRTLRCRACERWQGRHEGRRLQPLAVGKTCNSAPQNCTPPLAPAHPLPLSGLPPPPPHSPHACTNTRPTKCNRKHQPPSLPWDGVWGQSALAAHPYFRDVLEQLTTTGGARGGPPPQIHNL